MLERLYYPYRQYTNIFIFRSLQPCLTINAEITLVSHSGIILFYLHRSSETTTPCDPDDESNVLVPRPNDASACVNEPSSSEHGTRMVMANEIGSTFQVLPQINDRNEATEGHLAVPEKKDTVFAQQYTYTNS